MNLTAISTLKIRKYKTRFFKALIAVCVVIGLLMFWLGQEKPPAPKEKMDEKSPLYDLTKAVDDKSLWMFKAQNQLLEQQKAQEKLTQEVGNLKKDITAQAEFENLKARLEQLEQQTSANQPLVEPATPGLSDSEQNYFQADSLRVVDESSEVQEPPITQGQFTSSIFSETLALSVNEQSKLPHIDSFIPPGTYAQAILLTGVDVAAGVSSQANPKPVLLRLIHRGSLPNKAFGNLKDCRIIAAASGELSSERANMRLEKLSCVQPNGQVVVTDVDGSVIGEDGKNGLRGKLIIRDAEVLTRGFMGGLLSGLGKAAAQSYHSTSISPFGAINTSNAKGLEMFKQAGSQGMGDAFELMAKYNIQRAEQYQPIIQISAGREVDVLFHSGSQFGEKKIRKLSSNPVPNSSVPTNNIYGE